MGPQWNEELVLLDWGQGLVGGGLTGKVSFEQHLEIGGGESTF